jgi:hypothetical protein
MPGTGLYFFVVDITRIAACDCVFGKERAHNFLLLASRAICAYVLVEKKWELNVSVAIFGALCVDCAAGCSRRADHCQEATFAAGCREGGCRQAGPDMSPTRCLDVYTLTRCSVASQPVMAVYPHSASLLEILLHTRPASASRPTAHSVLQSYILAQCTAVVYIVHRLRRVCVVLSVVSTSRASLN